MSEAWRERLEAVVALGLLKKYEDGEVRCLNPTCRNEKLNRHDMTCWRCGLDRFEPASDEMRHALRFNYVPPPRRAEKPKEPPPSGNPIWITSGPMASPFNTTTWLLPSPTFIPPQTPPQFDDSFVDAIALAIQKAAKAQAAVESPRGRIARQKAAHAQRMAISESWAQHLDKVYGGHKKSKRPILGKKRGWSR